MCAHFTIKRDEEKIRLRDKILIYGAVPRADIKPTDLAPIIIPDNDDYLLTQMRWGWRVPSDKSPLINAKSETLLTLKTYAPHLENRCLILADGFREKGVRFIQPGGGSFAMAG
jgi:putative SOS response-associated peptidase YedK